MTEDTARADPPAASAGTLRLSLAGDVMLGRGLDQALPHPGDPTLRERLVVSALDYVRLAERANGPFPRPLGFEEMWGAALPEWRRTAPDVKLINLETAITRSAAFAPKGINYRMSPANAAALAAAGVDVCALANNHLLDFGRAGLQETLGVLSALKIPACGAGLTLAQAAAPAVLQPKGRAGRILVISAAAPDSGAPLAWRAAAGRPGINLVDLTEEGVRALTGPLARERQAGDVAVVSIHWGSNWGYQVPEAHRRFAHALIDTGLVDLVHGHSSHHPRPIEVYEGRLILYGCGDFLNDYEGIGGYEAFRPDLVALYFADLEAATGALLRLQLTPMVIRGYRLRAAARQDAEWLARRLGEHSRRFGVSLAPDADRALVAAWP